MISQREHVERAWEMRQTDPAGSEEIAMSVAAGATAIGDRTVAAIATVVTLYHRDARGESAEALAEIDRIRDDVVGDPLWLGRLENTAGVALFRLGEYGRALEHHSEALATRERIADRAGIAVSRTNIGTVHWAAGDYPAALEQFRQGLVVMEELGDRRSSAAVLNNIGNVYFALGDYPGALESHLRALAVREEIADQLGIAYSLNNIGVVHHALGDFAMALYNHQRALALRRQTNDRAGVADSLLNIGIESYALGDNQGAIEHYQQAIAIQEEIGDRAGIAHTLSNVAEVHQHLGNYPAALADAERAFAINRDLGSPADAAQAGIIMGVLRASIDEAEGAIATLEEALATATSIDAQATMARAHGALVDACERAGRYESALEHLREHLRITQEIQSEEMKNQLFQLEAKRRISEAEKEAEIERLRNVELAEALRQLKATQAQLVQSGKMAGIGQLTAGIAHEINNPINYVSASLPSLLRDLAELDTLVSPNPGAEEEAADVIEEMRLLLASSLEGARRVAAIVAGLRSFSRLDEGERKPADLHDGLEATIALLGAKLDGKITIDREYGELPAVECYPGEINQVFMNLLANAIDAIETEGTITITTTADDQTVNIAITDSGMGIAPEHLERIFDPFFTTKAIGKGTGLGLAIAYGIIRKHGGDVTVTSMPGSGSAFTLTLPLSFPRSPHPAVPPSPPPS